MTNLFLLIVIVAAIAITASIISLACANHIIFARVKASDDNNNNDNKDTKDSNSKKINDPMNPSKADTKDISDNPLENCSKHKSKSKQEVCAQPVTPVNDTTPSPGLSPTEPIIDDPGNSGGGNGGGTHDGGSSKSNKDLQEQLQLKHQLRDANIDLSKSNPSIDQFSIKENKTGWVINWQNDTYHSPNIWFAKNTTGANQTKDK
jgi:hypothetical protein